MNNYNDQEFLQMQAEVLRVDTFILQLRKEVESLEIGMSQLAVEQSTLFVAFHNLDLAAKNNDIYELFSKGNTVLQSSFVLPMKEFTSILSSVKSCLNERNSRLNKLEKASVAEHKAREKAIAKCGSDQQLLDQYYTGNEGKGHLARQAQLQRATQDHEQFNHRCKNELVLFLELKDELFGLFFQALVSFQLQIFDKLNLIFQDLHTKHEYPFTKSTTLENFINLHSHDLDQLLQSLTVLHGVARPSVVAPVGSGPVHADHLPLPLDFKTPKSERHSQHLLGTAQTESVEGSGEAYSSSSAAEKIYYNPNDTKMDPGYAVDQQPASAHARQDIQPSQHSDVYQHQSANLPQGSSEPAPLPKTHSNTASRLYLQAPLDDTSSVNGSVLYMQAPMGPMKSPPLLSPSRSSSFSIPPFTIPPQLPLKTGRYSYLAAERGSSPQPQQTNSSSFLRNTPAVESPTRSASAFADVYDAGYSTTSSPPPNPIIPVRNSSSSLTAEEQLKLSLLYDIKVLQEDKIVQTNHLKQIERQELSRIAEQRDSFLNQIRDLQDKLFGMENVQHTQEAEHIERQRRQDEEFEEKRKAFDQEMESRQLQMNVEAMDMQENQRKTEEKIKEALREERDRELLPTQPEISLLRELEAKIRAVEERESLLVAENAKRFAETEEKNLAFDKLLKCIELGEISPSSAREAWKLRNSDPAATEEAVVYTTSNLASETPSPLENQTPALAFIAPSLLQETLSSHGALFSMKSLERLGLDAGQNDTLPLEAPNTVIPNEAAVPESTDHSKNSSNAFERENPASRADSVTASSAAFGGANPSIRANSVTSAAVQYLPPPDESPPAPSPLRIDIPPPIELQPTSPVPAPPISILHQEKYSEPEQSFELFGIKVKELVTARYNFDPETPYAGPDSDLAFKKGDEMEVLDKPLHCEGWWLACQLDAGGERIGRIGMIPANRVIPK